MIHETRDDGWRGEVTNELRHINIQLANISQRLEKVQAEVAQALVRHVEYHRSNEHRWGLMAWAQRYPLRFALLVAAAVLWSVESDASLVTSLVRQILGRLVQ
ncbi:MAG: hypothetical protein N2Z21_06430 [Candidatus Sumerlaeaceae bacterium]|nr:hypothetical protein [Candidatus Sumerlaeaceae bacterium]